MGEATSTAYSEGHDCHVAELTSIAPTALNVISATPYSWPEPRSLPRRQWLFGHWLLKGEVTAVIAPGGTGKSTISTAIAISLASGQNLLNKSQPRGPQAAWIYNLEDAPDELQRQVAATCLAHSITRDDCADRLLVDSGLDQPLLTATEERDRFLISEDVFAQMEQTIKKHGIAALFVDPFVSSHAVQENNNGAINALVKRWKQLARDTSCAVILVHHTKKLGGREVTAEDGRGAIALRDAARVVLTLNPMSQSEAGTFGVNDASLRRSLVRIDTGKANRAPPGAATWIKLESQCLDNDGDGEPADFVGVATLWEKPDLFEGLSTAHLSAVQKGVSTGEWRVDGQANDWVGFLVAKVTGLNAEDETDKARLKAVLKEWFKNDRLRSESRNDSTGRPRMFVIAGKLVDGGGGLTNLHLQE
jgi:hypothetical protein